jgi:hypothetical protein
MRYAVGLSSIPPYNSIGTATAAWWQRTTGLHV